jgi:pimeloyl-ACP methyl ester carboxylesterase
LKLASPLREISVEGEGGVPLNVVEWSSQGPPLLLLHGFGLSSRVWDPVAPSLLERFRVLGLDLRGHGESGHDPDFRYHYIVIGKDVVRVLDGLELETTHMVGHSIAGHAAMGVAARVPERVGDLVLLEAGPELSARGRGGVRKKDAGAGRYSVPREYAEELCSSYPKADPSLLQHLAEVWLKPDGEGGFVPKLDPTFHRPRNAKDPEARRGFDREKWAEAGEKALWSDLARIRSSCLIVRGLDSSGLSSETVDRMLEVLPRVRACEIADAGHNLVIERPRELAGELLEFLTGERIGEPPVR